MWVFHALILYVALGICQENNLGNLYFSLDFLRSATYNVAMFDAIKFKSPRHRTNGSGGFILAETARMLFSRGLHYTASAEKMRGRNDLSDVQAFHGEEIWDLW
jgi:hypothetical protein